MFVAGTIPDNVPASNRGNRVSLLKYDLAGTLLTRVDWPPNPAAASPLRRAVAVAALSLANIEHVYVLVQEPGKAGTTDVMLLNFNPSTMEQPEAVRWSYTPDSTFHGNDVPVAMSVAGYYTGNGGDVLPIAFVAVAVQSQGYAATGWDIQTLLFSSSNYSPHQQYFANSRISYPGTEVPVGVSIINPDHSPGSPNPNGAVFVAGTTNVGTPYETYVAMGYALDSNPNGQPLPSWPTPQLYTDIPPGRTFTATAMVAAYQVEVNPPNYDWHENLYVTGYARNNLSPDDSANWVTLQWDNGVLNQAWRTLDPATGLNVGEYDGPAHRNDYPKAIEVRTEPGTNPPSYNHNYVWVAGSSQNADGTYDIETVQYENGLQFAAVDWRARLTDMAGSFNADDIPVAITSHDSPNIVEGSQADIFITGKSLSSTGNWDYLTVKYNSSTPSGLPPPPKDPNWSIFSTATGSGSGPNIPFGLAVYAYATDPGNRNYYKVFVAGTSLDVSGANTGNDFLTIKYNEVFP